MTPVPWVGDRPPSDAQIRELLRATADEVYPGLTKLEDALGVELDAPSFAMGLLAAASVVVRFDITDAARRYDYLIRGFMGDVRRARP